MNDTKVNRRQRSELFLSSNWKLIAILTAYVILVVIYSWRTPPFEGPDEPQHFAYITWLAEGKGFPPQGDAAWNTPIKQEAGQSPLYYLLASIPARLVGTAESPAVFRSNPHFVGIFPRIIPDNDNRAIHYPTDTQPLQGGYLALYLARALSLAFGLLLVISTYGLGRQVFPDVPQIALAATLIVAFNPQVIFISSVASNDIPAAAFSALTLWLLAVLLVQGPTTGRAIVTGAALGLAILTKASAIMLALPIAVGLFWLLLSRRQSLAQVVKVGIWLAVSTSLAAGWWLIRSWRLYGSPLGLETHDKTPWAINDPSILASTYERWQEVFRSYWLALGWGTIRLDDWVHDILLAFAVIALLGLILAAWHWWQKPRPRPDTKPALLFILTLAVLAVGISLEIWMRRVQAPLGRLMFPALAAFAVLLVTGWYSLHSKLPFIVAGIVLLLALIAPIWLIPPAYAPPERLSQEAIEQFSPILNVVFGPSPEEPIAELLSAKTLTPSVEAGNNVRVEVCWRPLAQTDQPYSVLIHLIGPEDTLVANRRTYPGLGRYPTTIWQPGYVFCDMVQISVEEDLAKTLLYKVEIALLDLENDERLPAFDANGNPIPVLFVDNVRLESLESKEPFVAPAGAGGSPVQLAAFDLVTTWTIGETNGLTLQWGVSRPVDKEYQVFVHLRDPSNGEIIAQADGPPLDGWYPTSRWTAGEIVVDDRDFPFPPNFPAGTYDLVVGLYDLDSGQRIGDEHYLGTVEVLP
jgi:4-amino-4-deoxy-L-arabinose transferase-like glycosyltransferase